MLNVVAVVTLLVASAPVLAHSRTEPDSREYLLGLIGSSRPKGVDPKFDCEWRKFAALYASKIQPELAGDATRVSQLHDALELTSLCGVGFEDTFAGVQASASPMPAPGSVVQERLRSVAELQGCEVYADAVHGSDSAAGTVASPLMTVAAAVEAARAASHGGGCQILLREGT